MIKKDVFVAVACLDTRPAVASAAADAARAADWPVTAGETIVGFAPGGPTDLFARLIAQKLTAQTGKNFFIENVPGAGGNVGAGRAAHRRQTAILFWSPAAISPTTLISSAHVPYDPLKDFDAVTLGSSTPMVLAVNPSVPAHSVKELVALDPGQAGQIQFRLAGHRHAAATGRLIVFQHR